ncbi:MULTISPECIES: sensor histidine kinase [Vagococcus]|uniref:histidine kinase n=1 Tax=Vagococcus fluvialis bH819 TaxID=1255619 RepID=A0A1X6WP58_9ENTE|nr:MULTISPECIES: sensor histidine kinase [Vagococcus]SLM86094.1 sensor histidine kinase [Vagococcus fluvialis bH819]HCM90343.1 sensor histidine kinase [Vagococcus sp.]
MIFINYLQDQIRLILLWFSFIALTGFILWLTPEVQFNLPSLIYIFLIGLVLLIFYLSFDYNKKKNWWQQLEINSEYAIDTPELVGASTKEELIYQEYFNEMHREHFLLLNEVKQQTEEQKDYIDSWVHEIKIPLASLNLITESIEDDISEKRFNQLRSNLKRMDDYVEQVLYYSRLDSFSKDYLINSYSLKKLVQSTIKQSADYFIVNNLSLVLEGEEYFVLTDEKWLQFILNQIISNAIKYTPNGGKIALTFSKNDRGVWLTISDDGIGIPTEDLQRIFDKGFTGKNGRNEETKSTGLGLYLAKSLAEKLGHHLYVESCVDKGTSFRILFPHLNYYADKDEKFML